MVGKIISVSTKIGEGRGGISKALPLLLKNEMISSRIVTIESHDDAGSRALSWISAACGILLKCKRGDIVWLHCGEWFSYFRKITLALLAKLKGGKPVFHHHSAMRNVLHLKWFRAMVNISDLIGDGHIFPTEFGLKKCKEAELLLTAATAVIPNAVNLEDAHLPYRIRRGGDVSPCILVLTRLEEGKGVDLAILAMEFLPDNFSMIIAGHGTQYDKLNSLSSASAAGDRIKFVGWVDNDRKRDCFLNADVFLLPSMFDSFGMGFIEAMSYGIPVVGLNYEATPFVVQDGFSGILASEFSPRCVAEAVLTAFSNRICISEKAYETARDVYGADHIVRRLMVFFAGL